MTRGSKHWIFMVELFMILIAGVVMTSTAGSKYRLGECLSSDDCGADQCCVVGMMRYSTPGCRPLRQRGERCRPMSNTPINQTLWYPNGITLKLTNSYLVLCPCEKRLTCGRQGICVPVSGSS